MVYYIYTGFGYFSCRKRLSIFHPPPLKIFITLCSWTIIDILLVLPAAERLTFKFITLQVFVRFPPYLVQIDSNKMPQLIPKQKSPKTWMSLNPDFLDFWIELNHKVYELHMQIYICFIGLYDLLIVPSYKCDRNGHMV